MAEAKGQSAKSMKMSQKRLMIREKLWPNLDESQLWNRKKQKGFTTIPRTMPLLFQIMDGLSNGKPVSSVYLDLWCRAYDESFVSLSKHQEMAFSAGYTGQRAVTTWRDRMRRLRDLGFIAVESGSSGEFSYALLWNPHLIVEKHHEEKTIGFHLNLYNTLIERMLDIGANDLDETRE